MTDHKDKLLQDILLEGEGGHKEALRRDCLVALNQQRAKQRIQNVALTGLRRRRRLRRFTDVALAAAAVLAVAFFVHASTGYLPATDSDATVAAGQGNAGAPAPAAMPPVVPATEPIWIGSAEKIVRTKSYPGIETIDDGRSRMEIVSNRSYSSDELHAVKSRKAIDRMPQLSRFAMARYIRGHAKVDTSTETGLAFKSPHGKRVFFEEGVPVRWLSTRINYVPKETLAAGNEGTR